MQLIATAIITGSPADISFTNIPQTYTDLVVLISSRARTGLATDAMGVGLGFNGYAQTNAAWRDLRGSGSGVSSSNYAASIIGLQSNISTSQYNSISVYIPNYASAGTKTMSGDSVTENNATLAYASLNAAKFDVAAAITSIQIGDFSYGGGLGVGSQAWLYGIAKGSGGATVA